MKNTQTYKCCFILGLVARKFFPHVQVSLWDTGGSERYRALTGNYFHKANGALLVYCVEDAYTFENLQKWIDDASNHIKGESFVWALIGNKCDLPNEVEKVGVEQLCERLQTKLFYSVSAKTGHNVSEAFDELIATIHRKQLDIELQQSERDRTTTFATNVEPTNKYKSNSCCR